MTIMISTLAVSGIAGVGGGGGGTHPGLGTEAPNEPREQLGS